MRKMSYLSPSSISTFYQDQKEFYLRYLSVNKPPRDPQTQPMSIGSAFDAYVKSYLHEKLFGKGHDLKYDLKTLFEAQVESHHRDWAWIEGQKVFEKYKELGCLNDLLLDLTQAVSAPKFEIEVMGVVDGYREGITLNVKGVTLLGKPDLFYVNKFGTYVILDWKVNGYLSNYKTYPMKGYTKLRPGGQFHRECTLFNHNGTLINITCFLEDLNKEWARQLAIYAWLTGISVGDDFIVAIDQVCGNYADLKIAEHRLRVKSDSQFKFFSEAQYIWDIVHSDHLFREMSKEESQKHCELLDTMSASLTEAGGWFVNATRR